MALGNVETKCPTRVETNTHHPSNLIYLPDGQICGQPRTKCACLLPLIYLALPGRIPRGCLYRLCPRPPPLTNVEPPLFASQPSFPGSSLEHNKSICKRLSSPDLLQGTAADFVPTGMQSWLCWPVEIGRAQEAHPPPYRGSPSEAAVTQLLQHMRPVGRTPRDYHWRVAFCFSCCSR